jgi:hypothetical protein
LNNSCRSRAVSGVSLNSLSGGNPDWNVGAVDWCYDGGRGGSIGRLDRLADGARTVSDGQGLRCSGSVCLGALSEGGALRAVSGIHISSNSGPCGGIVPRSLGTGKQADENERLKSLHVERLYW